MKGRFGCRQCQCEPKDEYCSCLCHEGEKSSNWVEKKDWQEKEDILAEAEELEDRESQGFDVPDQWSD